MDKWLEKIENYLQINGDSVVDEFEFECLLSDVNDNLDISLGLEAVGAILALMERHPLVNFGTPGALVHFIEKFYKNGYEELLEKSVRSTPAVHTVWLLNRLINGSTTQKANEYIAILNSIYLNEELHEVIRGRAKEFLDYQQNCH